MYNEDSRFPFIIDKNGFRKGRVAPVVLLLP